MIKIDTDSIIEEIRSLIITNEDEEFLVGNGIFLDDSIRFNKEKLLEKKAEIAYLLQELGINKSFIITLARLLYTKDNYQWNMLRNNSDFYALEYLLAASSACGFIKNNDDVINTNINKLGSNATILALKYGKYYFKSSLEWLDFFKYAAKIMCYPVNTFAIEALAKKEVSK